MKVYVITADISVVAGGGVQGNAVKGLAMALLGLGHEITLVLPFFQGVIRLPTEIVCDLNISVGDRQITATLHRGRLNDCPGLTVFFLEQSAYFKEPCNVLTDQDDRFEAFEQILFFCRGSLEALVKLALAPDVIHCHDWQTGLIPALLKTEYNQCPGLTGAAHIFTVHDAAAQGLFPAECMPLTGLDHKYFNWQQMEFHGQLALLKTGLVFADLVTTVSPGHAKELRTPEHGFGLDGVFRELGDNLVGIHNGAGGFGDETSPLQHEAVNSDNWRVQKPICKGMVQRQIGLPERPEVPLLAVLSRFTQQKGIDILAEALETLLQEDVQIVLHGTGTREIELELCRLGHSHPGRLAVKLGFDAVFFSIILAGSDMYLMPSRYESCGLTHLQAMHAGVVPIVSAVGGLASSVVDTNEETLRDGTATGFTLKTLTPESVCSEVRRALALYKSPVTWAAIVKNNFRQDWSWRRHASEYSTIYERTLRKKNATHAVVIADSARSLPFTIIDQIAIKRNAGPARIELCLGDIMEMPADNSVDVLVVSAFPDDYSPLPDSMIGALDRSGISVQHLATQRAVDLRAQFSCWLSAPVAKETVPLPFRRILCFEPLHRGTPAEQVGDIFRAIAPFIFDAPPVRSLAMPILASGYLRQSPVEMLQVLVKAAHDFLTNGLPLELLRIVAHPPAYLTEKERVQYIAQIKQTFTAIKLQTDGAKAHGRTTPEDFQYHYFISYSHLDKAEVDYLAEEMQRRDVKLFLDRTELDTGEAWQHRIFEALDNCWKVIAVYSPSYLESEVCKDEFNIAMCRARNEKRSLLLPIYLYSARLPTYMKMPIYLDCREFDRDGLRQAGWEFSRKINEPDGLPGA